MKKCAYCDSRIYFGGRKRGDLIFCRAACEQRGQLAIAASQLPQDQVNSFVRLVHGGDCPVCSGAGPVDVHVSHRIYSVVLLSSWSSRPAVCCKSCGTRKKVRDMVYSLLLGWWGFPWGLLMTPVQIGRNIFGIFSGPEPSSPSPELEKMLRLQLAAQAIDGNPRA